MKDDIIKDLVIYNAIEILKGNIKIEINYKEIELLKEKVKVSNNER